MKSIDEHEEEFWKNYNPPTQRSLCGLMCPECGTELEVNNFLVLTSHPPQRRVRCPKCGYVGSVH